MKHAYLIIAHHEFNLLKRLVAALDDARNDIYIHFDKKVKDLPVIETKNAGLFQTGKRLDIRWGNVSQIECEFVLFQEALKRGPYSYYHILSGVDIPIKSQDFIHEFFALHQGKEFVDFDLQDNQYEIERKVQRLHLFPKHFRSDQRLLNYFRSALRFVFLRMQYVLGFRRNRQTVFKKGLNWVSVTHKFASYLVGLKDQILATYKYTYCADEIFLQTACWNSAFREKLFDPDHDGKGSMRMICWQGNRIRDWDNQDFDVLMNSDALFARKFNSKHIEVVDRIVNQIQYDS